MEKVLSSCKESKVFKASNPMIAAILALLAEIHGMERLKLNISFVIEMTFKTFGVTVTEVRPCNQLTGLERQMFQNPDFSALALPEPSKLPGSGANSGTAGAPGSLPSLQPPPGGVGGGLPPGMGGLRTPDGKLLAGGAGGGALSPEMAAAAAAGAAASPIAGGAMGPGGAPGAMPAGGVPAGGAALPLLSADQGLFGKLHAYVVISPSLGVLAERLGLKRLVPVAVDRAICEIITPVVERSVTIACMTTYELVSKVRACCLRACCACTCCQCACCLRLLTPLGTAPTCCVPGPLNNPPYSS